MIPPGNQRVLLDSSFLYALFSSKDGHHTQAFEYTEHFTGTMIIPEIVLPEVVYLFRRASATPGW
jgi:predicted nucleic acid-binding protein